jgi:hypothetical protein
MAEQTLTPRKLLEVEEVVVVVGAEEEEAVGEGVLQQVEALAVEHGLPLFHPTKAAQTPPSRKCLQECLSLLFSVRQICEV